MKGEVKKKGKKRKTVKIQQHKASVLGIIGVVSLLAIVLLVACIPLAKKLHQRREQEAILREQLEAEKQREEELDELEEYVGTDEYVEDVARDKMGMIKENEIIFEPEQ